MPPRRQPLTRTTPLPRNDKPLRRTGRLRHRSAKTEQVYRTGRRDLVADVLDAHPVCQRCAAARSTEVHELKSRGRGGSITNRANCVALCHDCHHWITTHPAQAQAAGWLLASWEEEPQ